MNHQTAANSRLKSRREVFRTRSSLPTIQLIERLTRSSITDMASYNHISILNRTLIKQPCRRLRNPTSYSIEYHVLVMER